MLKYFIQHIYRHMRCLGLHLLTGLMPGLIYSPFSSKHYTPWIQMLFMERCESLLVNLLCIYKHCYNFNPLDPWRVISDHRNRFVCYHISKIHFWLFFDSLRSFYISISIIIRVSVVFYAVRYFSNFWYFYENFSVFRSDISRYFQNMRAFSNIFCILSNRDLGIIMWSFRVLAQIRNLSDDSKVKNLHKKFFQRFSLLGNSD